MSDREYVRRYFSEGADRWLAAAYEEGEHPTVYPVGAQRVRLTIQAVLGRVGEERGHLVDLGCGGGNLCFHAAKLGFDVTGIDSAEGMIAAAEAQRQLLAADVRQRVTFRIANVLDNGLPAESADVVTALGLIEYLEADDLLEEAARLLRPGGILVISCRNRLFNMASLNDYTRREVESGDAARLLAELALLPSAAEIRACLEKFLQGLRAALTGLEQALAADLREVPPTTDASGPRGFAERRRQHTPRQLATAAEAAGFESPRFIGVHPHPFPPALEAFAPRFYNRLATVLEAFETTSASLAWSSSFLGVFTRCPA